MFLKTNWQVFFQYFVLQNIKDFLDIKSIFIYI
jgi:hypothetical protein